MAAERAAKYDEVDDHISDSDCDDDHDSTSPVYDSFYGQGKPATILQLTNVPAAEFQVLL